MTPSNGERRPLVTDGAKNPGTEFNLSLAPVADMPTRLSKKRRNLRWPAIIDRADDIVRSYDTGVTLRQLFYRLVSEQVLPNTESAYKRLSELTANLDSRRGQFR